MAQAEKDDQTQAPSARRLAHAREEGKVAISRDVQSLAALLVAIMILRNWDAIAVSQFVLQMRGFMEQSGQADIGSGSVWPVWTLMMRAGSPIVAPILLAAWAAIVSVTLLQTGLLFRFQSLEPQFSRLNPLSGLARMFGGQSLVETGKAVAKLAAFAFAAWHVLAGLLPLMLHSDGFDAITLARRMMQYALHGALIVIGVQALIAALDLLWVRYRHQRSLRMSSQELRDEYRESEGDPQIKARIRRLRRQRAMKRMMQAVPKATVVVTNPTHYAVALAYDGATKSAPKIVAKGMDELAARIREVALANKVPLVANPPLARALYTVPVDAEIPREHFQVVAGIIAYVWRLRRPRPGGAPVR